MPDETSESALPPIQDVNVIGSVDWFLQSTIDTIILRGVEIGVTLTVGGSVVSGILISGKTYFKELGEMVAAGSTEEGDMKKVLGEAWSQYTVIYEKPEDAPEGWAPPPAGFVHLRNARYYAPGQHPMPGSEYPGFLWRGKLSSIDAFSIGNFS